LKKSIFKEILAN